MELHESYSPVVHTWWVCLTLVAMYCTLRVNHVCTFSAAHVMY